MALHNKRGARTARRPGPIVSEQAPSGRTFEGGAGYARDAQGELFLTAVTHMPTQKAFYELAQARDSRVGRLATAAAIADPSWVARFTRWLRTDADMRSAPLVLANEAVRGRLAAGPDHHDRLNDAMVDAACNRAEEPGETVAYWLAKYGYLPQAVRRGAGRAALRLYTQRAVIKYDTRDKPIRFARVLDLCRPNPNDWAPPPGSDMTAEQVAARRRELDVLFGHLHARMRNRNVEVPAELRLLRAYEALWALPLAQRRKLITEPGAAGKLNDAGMTHEVLVSWLNRALDGPAWAAIVANMGYLALLKNLNAISTADGVTAATLDLVAQRIADPGEVARAGVLPMQILNAYRATSGGLRFGHPLDTAIGHSLGNITPLAGRTLILVDTSTSMDNTFSDDGTVKRWDAATMFALATARRCESADVVSFSSARYYYHDRPGPKTKVFPARPGEALLKAIERWGADGYFLGGGTDTAAALRQRYAGHDRVLVLTDEQEGEDPIEVSASIPETVPMYTWNLAGYPRGHAPSTVNRITIGGLNDKAFGAVTLAERGHRADWPF